MATAATSRPHSSESSDSTKTLRLREMHEEPRSRVMRRLWDRMAELYGAGRWEREYGAQPNDAWVSALSSRTVADIARGVEAAQRDEGKFLPTAGAFARWCTPHSIGGAEYNQPLPSLEHLAGGSSVGRQWLAFMHLEGIVPRPPGMTHEQIEDALEHANIQDMRTQIARESARIRKLAGATE